MAVANFPLVPPAATGFGAVYTHAYPVPVQAVTVPEPATGDDWTYTTAWPAKVRAITGQLNTSATVATRYPTLLGLLGAAGSYAQYIPMTAAGLTASVNGHLQGWPGTPGPPNDFANFPTVSTFSFPDAVLPTGTTIQSVTAALQSGDQWEDIVLLLEPM